MFAATVNHFLELLSAVGARAQEEPKNLADAAPVVSDVSRLLARGSSAEVRDVAAALAVLRGQLTAGDADCHPADRLASPDALAFLAGAAWALEEVAQTRLSSYGPAPIADSVTRRETARALVLDNIGADPVSPSELLDAEELRKAGLRPDEISRAIGALTDAGDLELVSPPRGSDRRRKFYRRTIA